MKNKFRKILNPIISTILLVFSQFSNATDVTGELFSNSIEILKFQLEAPFAEIFKNKTNFNEDTYFQGNIKYSKADESGNQTEISVPVQVKVRGFSSRFWCPFPKLSLKFKTAEVYGTIFQNIKTVDLATHCNLDPKTPEEMDITNIAKNNHFESFLYQLLPIFNMQGFKSKRAFTKYVDTVNNDNFQNLEFPAFFLESPKSFLKRVEGVEHRSVNDFRKNIPEVNANEESKKKYDFQNAATFLPKISTEELYKLALFQSLIGNGDWFISLNEKHVRNGDEKTLLWNIKVIELPNHDVIPLAHDFNFTQFVAKNFSAFDVDNSFSELISKDSKKAIINDWLNKKPQVLQLVKLYFSKAEDQEYALQFFEKKFASLAELNETIP